MERERERERGIYIYIYIYVYIYIYIERDWHGERERGMDSEGPVRSCRTFCRIFIRQSIRQALIYMYRSLGGDCKREVLCKVSVWVRERGVCVGLWVAVHLATLTSNSVLLLLLLLCLSQPRTSCFWFCVVFLLFLVVRSTYCHIVFFSLMKKSIFIGFWSGTINWSYISNVYFFNMVLLSFFAFVDLSAWVDYMKSS